MLTAYVNLADLTAEHRDAPLTDVGRRQAAAVADYLAERIKPTQLYASTVARAAETAGMVADKSGLDPTFDNRLREIGTAYPDGRPVPESELEP